MGIFFTLKVSPVILKVSPVSLLVSPVTLKVSPKAVIISKAVIKTLSFVRSVRSPSN